MTVLISVGNKFQDLVATIWNLLSPIAVADECKHKAGGITERSETPTRLVITEEFSQISRSLAIQNLKHIQKSFESYPTRNWQPTESFKKWAGIYSPANSKDDTVCAVLEPLESGKILRWEDRKHGIAVIEVSLHYFLMKMHTDLNFDLFLLLPMIKLHPFPNLRVPEYQTKMQQSGFDHA